MKKFEYKVITIPTSIPLGSKGYEKIATEFETALNRICCRNWIICLDCICLSACFTALGIMVKSNLTKEYDCMKKKIVRVLPFIIMPLLIPVYIVLDNLILVDIFGCGCVPSTQTNMLNISFNSNDLRLTVFTILTIGLSVWSIFIAKSFKRKKAKYLYIITAALLNVILTMWVVKAFMWA